MPACDASMMQIPELIIEAVVPETVQMLVVKEPKLTGRPDVALAKLPRFRDAPTSCPEMELKVMVCERRLTVRVLLPELPATPGVAGVRMADTAYAPADCVMV